jgi:hypothetical protein
VWVIACLAEGLGIRGTARVFGIDAHTVLPWLVEAGEQLQACCDYCLREIHLTQVQLDELYAVLRAVRGGDLSKAEAVEQLDQHGHCSEAQSKPAAARGGDPAAQRQLVPQ